MDDFVLSNAARDDLFQIWDFIAQRDVEAADRVERRLYAEMKALAAQPGLGHLRTDLAADALRFWKVFTYLVLYLPETKPLQIVRILSGYRDIKTILEKTGE